MFEKKIKLIQSIYTSAYMQYIYAYMQYIYAYMQFRKDVIISTCSGTIVSLDPDPDQCDSKHKLESCRGQIAVNLNTKFHASSCTNAQIHIDSQLAWRLHAQHLMERFPWSRSLGLPAA